MGSIKKKKKKKICLGMISSERDLNFKVEDNSEISAPPLFVRHLNSFHLNQTLYSFLIDKANNFP